MSRALSQLESLIGSLSPHENRYVRQFISRQDEQAERRILELFDMLQPGKRTDPGKSSFAPSQQNYLFRAILKALRSYHEGRTVDILLREKLINAALLYERRLYMLSLRELESAQQLATDNERWAMVLEVLSLKAEVVLEHNSVDIAEKLEEIGQEAADVNRRLRLLSDLKNKQLQVYAFCRINYHTRSEEKFAELTKLAPAPGEDLPGSLFEQHYRMMSEAALSYFTGEYSQAMKQYEELLAVWESHPDRLVTERLIYKRFLSNVLSAAHATGNFAFMSVILSRLKSIPTSSVEEDAEKFQNLTYMELLYLMNTDGFDGLDALAKEIEKGLTRHKAKMNKARELAFCHNIAMAYFLLHNWKQSLAWIERIIAQEKSEHRQDLQHTARILRLVLWYELGKHDLLEYELINVERFLRKRKAWFAYESTVVKLFTKLPHANPAEERDLVRKFSLKLAEAVEGKTSAALPGSSEISYWAKSKVTGKSMRELLKEEH